MLYELRGGRSFPPKTRIHKRGREREKRGKSATSKWIEETRNANLSGRNQPKEGAIVGIKRSHILAQLTLPQRGIFGKLEGRCGNNGIGSASW